MLRLSEEHYDKSLRKRDPCKGVLIRHTKHTNRHNQETTNEEQL